MTESIIPWCFVYDRLNYARYVPAYYAEMKSLETHNQDIHNYLTAGGFTVQLRADNPPGGGGGGGGGGGALPGKQCTDA